jgi:hypothetical protein
VLPLGGMLPLARVPAFFRGVQRRPDLLAGCWFFYLLAIEVSAHKEARFVLPLIPLGIALAAGPAWETLRAGRARWPRLGLPLALGWAALSVLSPALQWRMNLDRDLLDAEVAAGRDPDLRGLLTSGVPWFAGGGGFYLQRAVPRVAAEDEAALRRALGDRRLTHALLYPDAQHPAPDRAPLQAAGFRPWKTLGRAELWRRPPEGRPAAP